jgi:hypothetical protein
MPKQGKAFPPCDCDIVKYGDGSTLECTSAQRNEAAMEAAEYSLNIDFRTAFRGFRGCSAATRGNAVDSI